MPLANEARQAEAVQANPWTEWMGELYLIEPDTDMSHRRKYAPHRPIESDRIERDEPTMYFFSRIYPGRCIGL
jgi:hypothetical protein